MKNFEQICKELNMDFAEASELFGDETLSSMQMARIGGARTLGLQYGGSCYGWDYYFINPTDDQGYHFHDNAVLLYNSASDMFVMQGVMACGNMSGANGQLTFSFDWVMEIDMGTDPSAFMSALNAVYAHIGPGYI